MAFKSEFQKTKDFNIESNPIFRDSAGNEIRTAPLREGKFYNFGDPSGRGGYEKNYYAWDSNKGKLVNIGTDFSSYKGKRLISGGTVPWNVKEFYEPYIEGKVEDVDPQKAQAIETHARFGEEPVAGRIDSQGRQTDIFVPSAEKKGFTPGYKGIYEAEKDKNLNKEAVNHLFQQYHQRDANAEELLFWAGYDPNKDDITGQARRVGDLEDTLAKTEVFSPQQRDKIIAQMAKDGQTYISNQYQLEELAKKGGLKGEDIQAVSKRGGQLFRPEDMQIPAGGDTEQQRSQPDTTQIDTEDDFTDIADDSQQKTQILPPGDPVADSENTTFDEMILELIKLDPFLSEQLSDPDTKARFDSLSPELQATYIQVLRQLQTSIEAGNVVNPDIELSPAKAQEFLDKATEELDPYYQEQIGFIKDDLNLSVQRLQEDYEKGVTRAETGFKEGLATQAEGEAQAGLAFGSERGKRESKTIRVQQEALGDSGTQLARSVQDLGTTAERQIGSEKMQDLGNIRQFDVSRHGFTPTGTRSLFAPQGGLKGSIPKQRTVAIAGRKSELVEAEKKQRILNYKSSRRTVAIAGKKNELVEAEKK